MRILNRVSDVHKTYTVNAHNQKTHTVAAPYTGAKGLNQLPVLLQQFGLDLRQRYSPHGYILCHRSIVRIVACIEGVIEQVVGGWNVVDFGVSRPCKVAASCT